MKIMLRIFLVLCLIVGYYKAYGQKDTTKVVSGVLCAGKKKKSFPKNENLTIQDKAQLDTLNYLKQFEANKANYIGQPFS